jgi:hypothetical protein
MRKLLVFTLLGLLSLIPTNVEAATTADVTITAYGVVVGSPSGLVVSYTGEDYVDITWSKGALADKTMVRVGTAGYPTSLTDGGLVYYGTGTTCQYGINYERMLANEAYEGLYFTAWSQRADGVWQTIGSTTGAYSFWQDVNMLFMVVVLIVLTLTFFAFKLRNVGLSIITAFGWAGLAIHQLTAYYSYASISGMEPLIGYTCVLMCICMFIAPIMFVRKAKVVAEASGGGYFDDIMGDGEIEGMMIARSELNRYKRPKRRKIPIIQPKRNR